MISDLICALATPPGRGAIAVVRLSGPGALEAARRVLRWEPEQTPQARHAYLATLHEADGTPFDQALVTFFPGPGSYTGEDLVEFSGHGGSLAVAQLLAALDAAGARPAVAGEFTWRAVRNGKLDLIQAEAVGDLVGATTRAQGRAALRQLEGGLSHRVASLRDQLVETLALLSYDIDFPEEDDGPVDRATLSASLGSTRAAVEALLRTAAVGERVRSGALVVLAGRPNAGKSSLFNAMLGQERALVTEIPGTTRDTIEADLDLDGWPVRLADTAGLRSSDDRIERMGIEVSRRYLAAADLVLLCVESGLAPTEEELALGDQPQTLVVRTKSDHGGGGPGLGVSATTGWGLDTLQRAIVDFLFGDVDRGPATEPLVTRERHRHGLEAAQAALSEAIAEIRPEGEAVLAAHHVRRAVTALEDLIGVVDVDEVLGKIFATFCVGK